LIDDAGTGRVAKSLSLTAKQEAGFARLFCVEKSLSFVDAGSLKTSDTIAELARRGNVFAKVSGADSVLDLLDQAAQ
jgi:hypothetical protein